MGRRAACCVPISGHKKSTPKERRAFDYWCPNFGVRILALRTWDIPGNFFDEKF